MIVEGMLLGAGVYITKKVIDYKKQKQEDERKIKENEKKAKRQHKKEIKKIELAKRKEENKQEQRSIDAQMQITDEARFTELCNQLHNRIDNFDNAVSREITEEKRAGIKTVLSGILSDLNDISSLYKKSKTKSEKRKKLVFQKRIYDLALEKLKKSQKIANDEVIKTYLEEINKHFKSILSSNQNTVKKTQNSRSKK